MKQSHRTDCVQTVGLIIGMLVVWSFSVPLQSQAITGQRLFIYLQGAATPLMTPQDITMACDQAAPVGGSTVNPDKAIIDDPARPGRVCIYQDQGTGPLLSTPFGMGTYEATMAFTSSGGAGPETPRVPFTRPGVPPTLVPTGLRLVR